jgi:hypothetical protein
MTIRCLSWRGSNIGDLRPRMCRHPNQEGLRKRKSRRRKSSRKRNNRKKRKRRIPK